MKTENFDIWCLVELFGHTKIAGRCTEQNIAGTNMLRVDVPETTQQPGFTRFFGSAAIYALNSIDEDTAKFYAEQLNVKPIQSWDIKEMLKKNTQLQLASTVGQSSADQHEDSNDELDEDDYKW